MGIFLLIWLNADAREWCIRGSVRLAVHEKLREARYRRDLDHHQPALSMPAHCFDDGDERVESGEVELTIAEVRSTTLLVMACSV